MWQQNIISYCEHEMRTVCTTFEVGSISTKRNFYVSHKYVKKNKVISLSVSYKAKRHNSTVSLPTNCSTYNAAVWE